MKNKNLSTVFMVIGLIVLSLFVLIPNLSDFLLNHIYFAMIFCGVLLVTCIGILIVSNNKVNVENFVVDNGFLASSENDNEVVAEQPVEKSDSDTDNTNEVDGLDYIRYDYSFKSKLILSSDEVKDYYNNIVNHATSYGAKLRKSWKKESIYLGRTTFAILTFKGKKLCVSFALDPKDYENSKYYFKDVSNVKKFEKTPLLMKITSSRKVKYTKELLDLIFANNGLEDKKLEVAVENIPTGTREELMKQGLIKNPSKVDA